MNRSTTTAAVLLAGLGILAAGIPASAQQVAGCWMYEGGGATTLVELEQTGSVWSGRTHHVIAAVESNPVDAAEVDGANVRLTLPWGQARQTVTLSGTVRGDSLLSTVRSDRGEEAVALTRVDSAGVAAARELVGYWRGGLEQGGAVVLRLGVKFGPGPCGQLVGSLDSPDQGATDLPLSGVRATGDSLHFQVPGVGGAFRGVLDSGRSGLRGIWTQGPGSLAMSLSRGDAALPWRRPQEPSPPVPYTADEVSYRNPADGTTLAATLTLPPGEGRHPAVLLLTGSGAQDRDESVMGHRPFLVIADYLTRRGVAVLRVDDRGAGGSSGNVMQATIADNVSDAAAGIELLAGDPRIDPARIGLIGHSEGGWVALELAAHSDAVAFIVLLAGPAVAPYELLQAQSRAILTASGEALVDEQVALTRQLLDILRAEPDDERARSAMIAAVDEWLLAIPPDRGAAVRARLQDPTSRAQFEQALAVQTTPWFRGLLAHDPVPSLEVLDVPVLALFGELDLQVPPRQSAPILESSWADHPDATVLVLPGLNHLFQHAETGLMAEYAQIDETFAPEALQAIGDWIVQRFVR